MRLKYDYYNDTSFKVNDINDIAKLQNIIIDLKDK